MFGTKEDICGIQGQTRAERQANAKLIAAAPELLEALKAVLKTIKNSEYWWMDSPNKGGFDIEFIEAAIQKATRK